MRLLRMEGREGREATLFHDFVRPKGGGIFALAGIWDSWLGADGSGIESFAILTTGANSLMAPIHDRMPVINFHDDYGPWLDASRFSEEVA